MENNDYYEPKIKTMRKDIKLTNKEIIKLQTAVINGFLEKKQQLISFLKNKIKECEYESITIPEKLDYWTGKKNTYQEVLDFINNGGKE